MCSLLHKVSHDINAFNQLRTMVMGQLLRSHVPCNMHQYLVKLWLSIKKFSYLSSVRGTVQAHFHAASTRRAKNTRLAWKVYANFRVPHPPAFTNPPDFSCTPRVQGVLRKIKSFFLKKVILYHEI